MQLPQPGTQGAMSLEEAILRRRTRRDFARGQLTLEQISQLLWAAQGVTGPNSFRAAPSAGATYPLETYLAVGQVEGIAQGLYHYDPASHSLTIVKDGDLRVGMAEAALSQPAVRTAAAIIVLSAVYERTTERYGDRGKMYVHIDVGHAAENVLLQATALGLGSVPVGAFRTRTIGSLLGLPEEQVPLYLVPIGRL